MVIEDRLLGFDAREPRAKPSELWDAARRDLFLLRVGVRGPLSVDSLVWPSVFDTGQGVGLPEQERRRLRLAGLPVPPWIGPNSDLWEDLARMRRYLADRWADPRPHALVAVSWFSDRGFSEAGPVGPYLGPTMPPRRDPSWRFLGFDVADGSRLSGLSNCGYSSAEVVEVRLRWGKLLNPRHLFGKPEHALRFRDLANSRIPEHAPFLVYGLFLIEEVPNPNYSRVL